MTAWINSMPYPVPGQPSCPAGEALQVQTALPTADADACRLAAAVWRGDDDAFREMYDRYHERLFRFALVLGHGDELLAGEIVQSVFVTAAAKLRRVESEEHLWNWLARVARQQMAKMMRQRRQDSTVVSVADLPERAEAGGPDSVVEET